MRFSMLKGQEKRSYCMMLPPIDQIDPAMRPGMSGTGNTRLIRQSATAPGSLPLPVKAPGLVRFVGKHRNCSAASSLVNWMHPSFASPTPPCSAFVPVRLNWVYCTSVLGKSQQRKLCTFSHLRRLMLRFCSIFTTSLRRLLKYPPIAPE